MNTFFWISYTMLWILVVPLVILNLVLFRQLGIMVMGTARGVNQSGIPVGHKIPGANDNPAGCRVVHKRADWHAFHHAVWIADV